MPLIWWNSNICTFLNPRFHFTVFFLIFISLSYCPSFLSSWNSCFMHFSFTHLLPGEDFVCFLDHQSINIKITQSALIVWSVTCLLHMPSCYTTQLPVCENTTVPNRTTVPERLETSREFDSGTVWHRRQWKKTTSNSFSHLNFVI